MSFALLSEVEKRASVMRSFLCTTEFLEQQSRAPGSPTHSQMVAAGCFTQYTLEDKVFRHCSVITGLYAIFEWFVEAMLTHWVDLLPRYYKYGDMTDQFKNAYRYGISQIVKDIDKRRYRSLSIATIVDVYARALHDESPWEVVHEALTLHETNLRRSEIEKLFSAVGVDNIWRTLESTPTMVSYVQDNEINKSLEQIVLEFVGYRNDAAHGRPDEILGMEALRLWIQFVESFAASLASVMKHRIVECKHKAKPELVIGTVVETYRDNVCVAKCKQGKLRVGQRLWAWKPDACTDATVLSLQLNGTPVDSVTLTNGEIEVGIKSDTEIRENAVLLSQEPL